MCSMRNACPVQMARERAERRICPPPSPCDPSILITHSSFHAYDLLQRSHDLNEIALCMHDRVDILVRRWRLIDHIRVLTALDAGGRRRMLGNTEALTRFGARHTTSRAMAAALETLGVSESTHDVRTRAHAPRDNPELATARANRTFACNQHILAEVLLTRRVVVVTVHRNVTERKRTNFATQYLENVLHHRATILRRVVLRPLHGLDVVVEVLRSLDQVSQVAVRQVDGVATHILTRELDERLTNDVADSTRTGMQHYPHRLLGIETDLDEVISTPERSELILRALLLHSRILLRDTRE